MVGGGESSVRSEDNIEGVELRFDTIKALFGETEGPKWAKLCEDMIASNPDDRLTVSATLDRLAELGVY